jgi:tetratricopeptide (TPR) repeat protein
MFFAEGEILESLPYYFNILNSKFREKSLFQIGKGYFFKNKFRESITNLDILLLEFPNFSIRGGRFIDKRGMPCPIGKFRSSPRNLSPHRSAKKNNIWQLFAFTQMGSIYAFKNEPGKAENAYKRVMEDFPHHPLFTDTFPDPWDKYAAISFMVIAILYGIGWLPLFVLSSTLIIMVNGEGAYRSLQGTRYDFLHILLPA